MIGQIAAISKDATGWNISVYFYLDGTVITGIGNPNPYGATAVHVPLGSTQAQVQAQVQAAVQAARDDHVAVTNFGGIIGNTVTVVG